eukprot:symbB.v1.2.021883.t1/scaffold1919.1/size107341/3
MARIPSSLSLEDLDQILPHLVDEGLPDGGEFVVASLDEGERTASLVAVLVYHGFLPMSGVGLLLGKLHLHRCVLDPRETHLAKKVRKRAKAFRLTVGEAWPQVVEHIQRLTYTTAPGDCWLTDKVVKAYEDVQKLGPKWRRGIRFISVELWHIETKELVAGEIGYTCGSVYSSCTGFSVKDKYPSAGAVQLAALGAWLVRQDFKLWDLGMELEYKMDLGGHMVPRAEWATKVRQWRSDDKVTLENPSGDEGLASQLLSTLRERPEAAPTEKGGDEKPEIKRTSEAERSEKRKEPTLTH